MRKIFASKEDAALADADGELGRGQEIEDPSVPFFYVFLPLIPLVLVFAAHFLPSIKIDVITANFIGFAVTFVCEFIVRKDRSRIPSDMAEIFKGWRMFSFPSLRSSFRPPFLRRASRSWAASRSSRI